MLAEMPAHTLFDWQKYLRYGTSAERLIDNHLSMIAAILANGLLKGRKYKPKDFRLLPDKPVYRSPMYMRNKMIAMTLAAGGTIIDNRGS